MFQPKTLTVLLAVIVVFGTVVMSIALPQLSSTDRKDTVTGGLGSQVLQATPSPEDQAAYRQYKALENEALVKSVTGETFLRFRRTMDQFQGSYDASHMRVGGSASPWVLDYTVAIQRVSDQSYGVQVAFYPQLPVTTGKETFDILKKGIGKVAVWQFTYDMEIQTYVARDQPPAHAILQTMFRNTQPVLHPDMPGLFVSPNAFGFANWQQAIERIETEPKYLYQFDSKVLLSLAPEDTQARENAIDLEGFSKFSLDDDGNLSVLTESHTTDVVTLPGPASAKNSPAIRITKTVKETIKPGDILPIESEYILVSEMGRVKPDGDDSAVSTSIDAFVMVERLSMR